MPLVEDSVLRFVSVDGSGSLGRKVEDVSADGTDSDSTEMGEVQRGSQLTFPVEGT